MIAKPLVRKKEVAESMPQHIFLDVFFSLAHARGDSPQPHSRSSAGAASGLMEGVNLSRINREIEPHLQHSNRNVPVTTREQPMAALCCREKATWDNHRDCLTLLLSHTRHSGKVPKHT